MKLGIQTPKDYQKDDIVQVITRDVLREKF